MMLILIVTNTETNAIFMPSTLIGSWCNWGHCSMWKPLLICPRKKVNSAWRVRI